MPVLHSSGTATCHLSADSVCAGRSRKSSPDDWSSKQSSVQGTSEVGSTEEPEHGVGRELGGKQVGRHVMQVQGTVHGAAGMEIRAKGGDPALEFWH